MASSKSGKTAKSKATETKNTSVEKTPQTQKSPDGSASSSDSINKHALKATVVSLQKSVSEEAGQSKQLQNPFEVLEQDGKVIRPPFDLLSLSTLPERSTEMNQVIEAMVVNIDGFGHHLVERIDLEHEALGEDQRLAVRQERVFLENFFNCASLDESLVSLRKKMRRDLETTGNGYLEVIRDAKGSIQGIEHMPAYQMRLGKLEEAIPVDFPILQLNIDGSVEATTIKRVTRFKGFVQSRLTPIYSGSTESYKVRWFKEFGDPRVRDNRTGEVVPPEEVSNWQDTGKPMPESLRANEVVHFKIYSSRTPYGVPRYIGNLLSIFGDRKAEEINYNTFKSNNIPSMIVAVSNGIVSPGTVKRIQNFVESQIAEPDNYSSFLILEAEGAFEGEDAGNVKLDIKPLTQHQHKDELFQEYSKHNQSKIRRAWRMPPVLVGDSNQYNRATAETSRRLADEQIFDPERREFDSWVNRRLFAEMGIIYHTFRTNSPNTTDNSELVKILSGSEKTGGVTPRIARLILEDILSMKLPEFKDDPRFDPDLPFSLLMAEMVKNKADPTEPSQQVVALKNLENEQDLDFEEDKEE